MLRSVERHRHYVTNPEKFTSHPLATSSSAHDSAPSERKPPELKMTEWVPSEQEARRQVRDCITSLDRFAILSLRRRSGESALTQLRSSRSKDHRRPAYAVRDWRDQAQLCDLERAGEVMTVTTIQQLKDKEWQGGGFKARYISAAAIFPTNPREACREVEALRLRTPTTRPTSSTRH
jgi:hypothetical protein